MASIWHEFVFGGHLLSINGAAITATVLFLLGLRVDFLILLISYLLLQVVYNHNHFKEMDKDELGNPERVGYLQKQAKILRPLIVVYSIALLISSALANIQTLLLTLFLLLGGYLFSIKAKTTTERLPIFKNLYVALFWGIGAVLLVASYHLLIPNLAFLLIFLCVFTRTLLDTIYFDIKDIESDKRERLKTLPILMGKRSTLRILHILNAASLLPIVVGVVIGRLPLFSLGLLIFLLYGLIYIARTERLPKEKIRFLSYTMVDGEQILWPLALMLTRSIIEHLF